MARSDSAFCRWLFSVRDKMSCTAANWAAWREATARETVFFRIFLGWLLPLVSPSATRRGFPAGRLAEATGALGFDAAAARRGVATGGCAARCARGLAAALVAGAAALAAGALGVARSVMACSSFCHTAHQYQQWALHRFDFYQDGAAMCPAAGPVT
jgi:hypothetical protein